MASKHTANNETQVKSWILSNAEKEIISSTTDAWSSVMLTFGSIIVPWVCVETDSSYTLACSTAWPVGELTFLSAVLRLLLVWYWLKYDNDWSCFRILAASTWEMHLAWRWFNTVRGCKLAKVGVTASINLCSDSSTSGLNIMSKSPFSFTITVLLVPYSFWDASSSSSHPVSKSSDSEPKKAVPSHA